MSPIIIYLILATTIVLSYSISGSAGKGTTTGDLGILSLSLGMTMEENIIRQIILVGAIVVYVIGRIDGETAILFQIGTVGLLILGVAEELIIIYIAIELISLTFYILAGRERKGMKSTEAGLKYFILGALSSGIMLMGITQVYAQTGTTDIEQVEVTNGLLIVIGLLFKLGAAPFHMWVPDVYEGAATIVTTYFAAVPKIAYLGVLMKLGGGEVVLLAGILSIAVGSIGAINQTKLKRMLAYSAIGHVGFMLIGIGVATYTSVQATVIYMILYIIMTINSFTVILSQGVQKIVELRGISRRNGVLGMTMGLGFMSIAGVPPLAGFYSKYLVVLSAVEDSEIAIAIIAVLLSVISSYFYVRVIRYMYFKDQAEITVATVKIGRGAAIVLGVTTYVILTIMMYPSILITITVPVIY